MIARFLDFLYPPICELCQKPLECGDSICSSCADLLPRISEPFCQNCGESFDGNLEDEFRCQNCLGLTHAFHFARASLKGTSMPFHLVHSLKYRRRFFLAQNLAELMEKTLEEDSRFREMGREAILVPVPLHWRRQQWRQGNQAYELSRQLSKLTGLPLSNALKRVRSTRTQTKLSRKQRLSNLRGAFRLKRGHLDRIRGAQVILVDDVFTTGATAHECTRILKQEGQASKVAILTLVRG
ncbi:MAG: ComF family protein [Akkermansiaceae bacterium]|jgi:ComF family protein